MHSGHAPQQRSFAALRRFARPAPRLERCDLCGAGLAAEHPHLVEPRGTGEAGRRRLHCCCDACALLFGSQQGGRYRRVRTRLERLPDFRMTAGRWESLLVPVNLAFFYASTHAGGVVAVYPSPAGALEAAVPPESWEGLVTENPPLRDLEPDLEALLVNRVGGAGAYYRASLDRCYELVGLVRKHWRGLSGGSELWDEVERFFTSLETS
jgi:hypothetical protein